MEFVVIFQEFLADGGEGGLPFFADDDIQKQEGRLADGLLEQIGENRMFFRWRNDGTVEHGLHFGVAFQGGSDQGEIVVHCL